MPEFTLPAALRKARPAVGIVLGSGLGAFAGSLGKVRTFGYAEIDGLPVAGVPGHAGRLHLGWLAGVEVAVAEGRVHVYEGRSAREVAATVRLFRELGIGTLLLTNAAGIVNANFRPGRWMLVTDHLNLARLSPLTGSPAFLDQSEAYSPELRELLQAESLELTGRRLHEGVYAWVNGPEYETPAEIRMLRSLGADAVGMSTVPEVIQARALGMKVAALSCLTNYGAGLSARPLDHTEVVAVGAVAAAELFALLESAVPAMGEI